MNCTLITAQGVIRTAFVGRSLSALTDLMGIEVDTSRDIAELTELWITRYRHWKLVALIYVMVIDTDVDTKLYELIDIVIDTDVDKKVVELIDIVIDTDIEKKVVELIYIVNDTDIGLKKVRVVQKVFS